MADDSELLQIHRLHAAGRFTEAAELCTQLLRVTPTNIGVLNALSVILHSQGKYEDAISTIRRAIANHRPNSELQRNLGLFLATTNQMDAAVEAFGIAHELDPNSPVILHNLATALKDSGRLAESESALRTLLAKHPRAADAWHDLGSVLFESNRFADSVEAYRKALELVPTSAITANNLGVALVRSGRLDESINAFSSALKLQPVYVQASCNLGSAYLDSGQLSNAIGAFEQAALNDPNCSLALGYLGTCYKHVLRHDDAFTARVRRAQIDPSPVVASDVVFDAMFLSRFEEREIVQHQKEWAARFAAPREGVQFQFNNTRDQSRRLRIGYISPNFNNHVVGKNIVPLLENHNHDEFEIFCYSNASPESADTVTQKFKSVTDQWREIYHCDDNAALQLIRRDQIDILIDLAMHMHLNRLPLLARKPAPVQICFAAYPGGTGLPAVDYRISDVHLDPLEQPCEYVEQTLRLPNSFWCYDPSAMFAGLDIEPGEPPMHQTGSVMFGNLCNPIKVTVESLELWSRVLREVPGSRITLLHMYNDYKNVIRAFFSARGIAADRVSFCRLAESRAYFSQYQKIDIVLDSAPYNGHTTSLDALWMGVPVVTMAGRTVVGRAGVSQLSNLGLKDLIAHTADDYVKTAVHLAGDSTRLRSLRAELRGRMLASPICDAQRFARDVESLYRQAWKNWCG